MKRGTADNQVLLQQWWYMTYKLNRMTTWLIGMKVKTLKDSDFEPSEKISA